VLLSTFRHTVLIRASARSTPVGCPGP